jgi:hypothetical protein
VRTLERSALPPGPPKPKEEEGEEKEKGEQPKEGAEAAGAAAEGAGTEPAGGEAAEESSQGGGDKEEASSGNAAAAAVDDGAGGGGGAPPQAEKAGGDRGRGDGRAAATTTAIASAAAAAAGDTSPTPPPEEATSPPPPETEDPGAESAPAGPVMPPTREGPKEKEEKLATTTIIVDRIYAGRPGTGCDAWFHHGAAMAAASDWDPEEASSPFGRGGGHLLARQPRFRAGDRVQVLYEGEWYDATVLRRRPETRGGRSVGFLYGVHYSQDGTKQSGVDESRVRPRPEALDSKLAASKLGMKGWDAYVSGGNRYKIVDPATGKAYWSKKHALEAYAAQHPDSSSGGGLEGLAAKDPSSPSAGDRPWRSAGSELLGRQVLYSFEHRASARRTVTVDQLGTVAGWIGETDVDRSGAPAFVSQTTGRPARLYRVELAAAPHHPYASLLLESVDMEEEELERCLLAPEELEPASKKAKSS